MASLMTDGFQPMLLSACYLPTYAHPHEAKKAIHAKGQAMPAKP